MSTFPPGSSVAVWDALAVVMLPVAANVPSPGSYSSVLATTIPFAPPAMSTNPFCSNVAVCDSLATVKLPVRVKFPGSAFDPPLAPAPKLPPTSDTPPEADSPLLPAMPPAPRIPPLPGAPPVPRGPVRMGFEQLTTATMPRKQKAPQRLSRRIGIGYDLPDSTLGTKHLTNRAAELGIASQAGSLVRAIAPKGYSDGGLSTSDPAHHFWVEGYRLGHAERLPP